MNQKNPLVPILSIDRLKFDCQETLILTSSEKWIKEFLSELRGEDESSTENLQITLQISRNFNHQLQDHVFVKVNVKSNYWTPCIRCLSPSEQTIDHTFSGCFIDSSMSEQPEYEDCTTIFYETEEVELYFFERNRVDLAEFIHEHLFLNVESLPLHDQDCKGLCLQCGTDLNAKRCQCENVFACT